MLKQFYAVTCVTLFTVAPAFAGDYQTGFRQYSFDEASTRPLNAAIWYPTESTAQTEIVAENKAFHGVEVIRDAPIPEGHFPLVVMSHGMEGSWRNLSWLGTALAKNGYIVAASDHPGTTAFNLDPKEAEKLWERPRDLSRLLDKLIEIEALNEHFDLDNISAIGHSLGGWTVMSMAGARYNRELLSQACKIKPELRACSMVKQLGLDKTELEQDLKDGRIKKVISLDPGLASGFTPESLKRVDIPTQLFAAGVPFEDMPFDQETGYLDRFLGRALTKFIRLAGSTHFSFVGLCKEGAQDRIATTAPGREVICEPEKGTTRQALHEKIIQNVLEFLGEKITAATTR